MNEKLRKAKKEIMKIGDRSQARVDVVKKNDPALYEKAQRILRENS